MSARNTKRGRTPNSEILAKDMKPEADSNDATDNNTEAKVKKGPGRPRKQECEKKKWIPTGRARGRPRTYPIDHDRVKKPRGRPRTNPIMHKDRRPRGRPRKTLSDDGEDKLKKVTVRGQKRPGRPKKE